MISVEWIRVGVAFMAPILAEGTRRIWLSRRRHAQLAREGFVFPVQKIEDGDRVMHLRASLDLIPYGANPETIRGYTHIGDVLSVMRIYEHFDDLPIKMEFDYFSELKPSMKNVVIIGSSSRSPIAREIGEELYRRGIRVKGNQRHAHFEDANGNSYRCSEVDSESDGTQSKIVARDAGIIFRRNFENGTSLTLLAGIHTHGTYAATLVALDRKFQQRVRKSRLKEFVQFVTVGGITKGPQAGIGIHNIEWTQLPLDSLQKYPLR